MENASKALIIAGAILLAILIIGLGIYIYNQAANSMNNTGMDQMEIRQVNGQFDVYIDRELTSVEAKSLYDTIKNCKEVAFEPSDDVSTKGDIEAGTTYKADVTYTKYIDNDTSKGFDRTSLIEKIAIVEAD